MERLRRRRPQGTLLFIGKKRNIESRFYLVGIKEDQVVVEEHKNVYDLVEAAKAYPLFWLHVSGLEDEKNVEILGKSFNIHHLILQSTLDTFHRMKAEQVAEHLNVTFKVLHVNKESNDLEKEHVSIVVGDKYIISFSEMEFSSFENAVSRIKHVLDNKHQLDRDRILYILLDIAEDSFTETLEAFEKRVSRFELEVFSDKLNFNIQKIYKFKRQELRARKALLPAREVVTVLMKQPNIFISPMVSLYFKDLHDHLAQVSDSFETVRETLNGVIDIALSKESEKTNHVVKILTILSTIFLPLNFLVGFFGMNFKYMPLLEDNKGFAFVLIFMLAVSGVSLLIFRRKKWL